MAASKRQLKFSKLIQQEVSALLHRDFSGSFMGKLVTITDVTMSPDLGLARLYVSIFPIKETDVVLSILEENKSRIRGSLGRIIGKEVRVVPELAFFADSTAEMASKMDSLIDSLDIPEQDDSEEE